MHTIFQVLYMAKHLKLKRAQRRAEEAEQRVGVRTPRSADKDTQFGE